MKKETRPILCIFAFCHFLTFAFAQNVGIGTSAPEGKLHIKGDNDTSQLCIDAAFDQTNLHPIVCLRDNDGADLMWINSDHPFNLFIGLHSGQANNSTTGIHNAFVGSNAGSTNSSGFQNSAFGSRALLGNTTGHDNTAIGMEALKANSTGVFNTAVGSFALLVSTTSEHNVAIGAGSAFHNTEGSFNTTIGTTSLFENTTGWMNTATGSQALYSNTTGNGNTALGRDALYSVNSDNNTAIGFEAGMMLSNGSYNTFVGAYTDAVTTLTNSTCIGADNLVGASNQVRIGSAVTSIGGPQDWSNTSDGRIKLNVQADVPGLSFINLLQPVTYNKSLALEDQIIGRRTERKLSADNAYETMRYSGFIAQDVEVAAQSIGYEFSGVDAPQNDKSLYGLRYAEFVVPLVKAVQELALEVELLKKENAELKNLIQRR